MKTTAKLIYLFLATTVLAYFSSCSRTLTFHTSPYFPTMIAVEGNTFTIGAALQNPTNHPTTASVGAIAPGGITTVRNFYISSTPITQEQFKYVMGANPSYFQIGALGEEAVTDGSSFASRPVERVSWFDAIAFANRLSIMQGRTPVYTAQLITGRNVNWGNLNFVNSDGSFDDDWHTLVNWQSLTANHNSNGFRLPTEAEWEFAARGGHLSPTATGSATNDYYFSNTNDGKAVWHLHNPNLPSRTTQPVGQFNANALGLYDMSGNVWEWTWNWFGATVAGHTGNDPMGAATGTARVVRGGSWTSNVAFTRVSFRFTYAPYTRVNTVGFRVVSTY